MMNDFTFYAPTKVIFGREADENVGEALKEYGANKVFVLYGGGSVKRSGLLDKVEKSLAEAGIAYVEKGGAQPNPTLEFTRSCVDLCKKENVDFMLAVGGASALDTVKLTAISVKCGCDPWELVTGEVKPTDRIPFGVVLTIAAAGSEMSNSAVVTNTDIHFKRGLSTDCNRPTIAFLNPEYTFTVSKFQTGCGIVDMMTHTMERYFTDDVDNDLTERISEGLLVAVKDAGTVAINQPDDYEARATLMWASSLSHNGLTGCGKKPFGWPPHQISHGICGVDTKIAHGAALSVVFPAWMKYVYKYNIPLFARFAVNVWNVEMDYEHPEKTALAGIEAMKNYFRSIDMPVTNRELGILPEHYDEVAELTTYNQSRKVKSFIPLGKAEIIDILKLAE